MSTVETRNTDDKGRVTLPKSFANSVILIDQVSETELRIRKARVIPEDDLRFLEESERILSDRDRDAFLTALNNPPAPSKALRQAVARHRNRRE